MITEPELTTDATSETEPIVTIVVVTFNSATVISDCIESLAKTKYTNFKVLIVDNASTDGTRKQIERLVKFFPTIRSVYLSKNIGYTGANNIGFFMSRGSDYVVFLNPDTILTEEWLIPIIHTMQASPHIAALQPKLLKLDKRTIDSCGNDIDRLGFGLQFEGFKDSFEYFNRARSIFYADGAAIVLRTSSCKCVEFHGQLLDNSYHTTYEEVDLCWRLRLMGFEVIYEPRSIIYHKRSFSRFRVPKYREVYRRTSNKLLTMYKNYSLYDSLIYIPIAMIFDFLGVVLLSRTSRDLLLAYKQGVHSFYKTIRQAEQFRQFIQANRKISDSELKRHMVQFDPLRTYHSVFEHER